jgi:hypothetical protein
MIYRKRTTNSAKTSRLPRKHIEFSDYNSYAAEYHQGTY